jgi:hypothetical protein
MQTTESLLGLLRERGKRGLPLNRVYRQLYNTNLYLSAYGRIYRNAGAMTPGVTGETADGTSLETFETIIAAVRQEQYHWQPARRTYIPKKRGNKKRPLGMPIWVSYCLSFQAMLGIPSPVGLVDWKSQPTTTLSLYHIVAFLTNPSLFPLPLDGLTQCRNDLGGERNPARPMIPTCGLW